MAMVSLQSCYDRARKYMAQSEYDKAEAMCQHILQYYPHDLGTFQLLGQIDLERKRARDAREYFRRVLAIDPENVSAHWGMGIAYQDEGSLERAIAEFEFALEIKPDLSDLRGQLLRLYTDLYGASRAQLRLSRAGLGRLYVKGEMLDKAVEEFSEVLKADPSRLDVHLSLIEALWRGGRIDESAQHCELVLQKLPDALKANLILGYVQMEAGQQNKAEELWGRAAACDPNNTMARALFEMAPMQISQRFLSYDAATLPNFDEAAWEAQKEVAAIEAALPEELVVPEEIVAPVEEMPAVPSEEAAPVGVSWLDSLATGEGIVEEEEGELIPGVAPFDLEGLGAFDELPEQPTVALPVEAEEPPTLVMPVAEAEPLDLPGVAGPVEEGEPDELMEPFSLEDLGLSAEEITSLEGAIASAGEIAAEEGLPGVEPFSLGGALGLGEEDEGLPELEPFSLEDAFGLGEEEEVPDIEFSLEGTLSPPAEEEGLLDVEPFSLGDTLGLGEEEGLPGVEPFSLGDALGLGEEEGVPGMGPFSLEGALAPATEEELPGVEPFSLEGFEDLGAEGVRPFSLDDLGLEEPTSGVDFGALEDVIEGIDEEEVGLPAFSWQEPAMREEPAFMDKLAPEEEAEEVPVGLSLFEKMVSSRQELAEGEPDLLEEVGEVPEEALALEGVEAFSLEELGLEAPVVEEAPGEVMALEGVEPFSLEELSLGVPEEEAPAEAVALESLEPFSLEELGLEVPEEAIALEGVEPFSLDELDVAETIAAEVEPAWVEAEEAAVAAAVPEEEVLQPFTLEELGLTPEEVVSLGLSDAELAGMGLLPEDVAPVAIEEEVPPVMVAEEVPTVVEEIRPVEEVVPEEIVPVVEEGPSLDELRRRFEGDSANEGLRLELAQACADQDEFEEAVQHYKVLIKSGRAGLEDDIVADLEAWIGREREHKRLHRLHRLLGDTFMKKGLYQRAISEYAWVLSEPGKG